MCTYLKFFLIYFEDVKAKLLVLINDMKVNFDRISLVDMDPFLFLKQAYKIIIVQ